MSRFMVRAGLSAKRWILTAGQALRISGVISESKPHLGQRGGQRLSVAGPMRTRWRLGLILGAFPLLAAALPGWVDIQGGVVVAAMYGSEAPLGWVEVSGALPPVNSRATQVNGVWVFTAPPATAAQILADGLQVTSTSAPGEDGTYEVDAGAQLLFTAAYASCGIRTAFPDGSAANYTWFDIGGVGHTIPDCAHMTALAAAASAFVSQVLHGQVPAQPVTLP